MINSKPIHNLFKPHKFHTFNIQDVLDATGLTMKDYLKIYAEDECSKSIDESCINTECPHNFLKLHEDELYIEVMQEVEAENKAVEERTKRDMEKYEFI